MAATRIKEAPLGAALVQGKGKRILCVDDSILIVNMIRRTFSLRGFHVYGYTDPCEALVALFDDPFQFDLVVTDYEMPHISGLNFAKIIKSIRSDLPVIMVSGNTTKELQDQAPCAGIRELITKGDTVNLLKAVDNYI